MEEIFNGIKTITVTAPTNIAVIKYWGKRCTQYNLPINSSLSVTLDQNDLKATTSVSTSPEYEEDEIILNEESQSVADNKRLVACLQEIRRMGRKQCIAKRNESSILDVKFYSQKVHIRSENNFPTAAGLASSAAGYAALVFALGKLFQIVGDLTPIARQGSGSACRSLHGGFVEWVAGVEDDGRDSIGVQLYPESHWPELRILILVVSSESKKVGSTEAMIRSVETSSLLKYRSENIVPHRLKAIKEAISEKDFTSFAELTMKESNQLHAVCQDSYPPIHYLNETSKAIINFVHKYNEYSKATQLAYTFDAGPNACLFTTAPFLSEISDFLLETFPPSQTCSKYFYGTSENGKGSSVDHPLLPPLSPGSIQYIIRTRPGPGPCVVPNGLFDNSGSKV